MPTNQDFGGFSLPQLQQMGIGQQYWQNAQPGGSGLLPRLNMPSQPQQQGGFDFTSGINMGNYFQPIQQELGTTQTQGNSLLNNFLQQRQGQLGQLQGDLTNQINAGLTASDPAIEDRLGELGLLQSGAYPEAIARQRANLTADVLPTLTNFDLGTFNTANQIPFNTLNTMQGLQQGSIGRGFSQQDIANQQQFQQGLANQANQTQQLGAILGLAPALLGSGGLPGLFGGRGTPGTTAGGTAGGTSGGMGSLGGLLPDLSNILVGGNGGIGNILMSGGLGAGGAALGNALGLGGAGSGVLGALGSLAGGGGALGGLGAGLGGAFGGSLGAGVGGALGDVANSYIPDIADYFAGAGGIGGGISDLLTNFGF